MSHAVANVRLRTLKMAMPLVHA